MCESEMAEDCTHGTCGFSHVLVRANAEVVRLCMRICICMRWSYLGELSSRFAVEFAGGSAPLVIRMLPLQERRNEATGAASCSIL